MLSKKFEEQVQKHPHKIAIKTADSELTYEQLNECAQRIAYEIVEYLNDNSKNNGMNNIALLFEHGIDMIAGTIGALKAGKTYIPFDPTYPVKRLAYMLQDSEAKIILTNSKNLNLAEKLSNESNTPVAVLNIDDIDCSRDISNLDVSTDENEVAYILYTSGSTGIPKGVFQTHRNIFHFIKCYTETMHISPQDKMTLFSAFSHDAAIMDIYSALLNGATLYPLNIKEQGRFNELASWLTKEEITIWHSVPTLYRYFVNALKEKEALPALRYIVLGGEIVIEHDVEMFKKLFPGAKLVNLYGQTESSFNSAQIFTAASKSNKITLGEPVEETELLVIDEDRNEVDVLEVGEIVVLSDYVACGYWKDEEKTGSVFEHNSEAGKLYWTGDLGRLLPDGTIKFVGRKGSVVKIRGYRVDTGEVESRLLKHEAIKEAVVLGKKDHNESDDFLCAYIVADKKILRKELKSYLSEYLPEYMIPTYFIQLQEMPLTPNGKLDRKALPEPEHNGGSETIYEEPGNEIEQKLVKIWSEILEARKIGINHDFFELGGHSLKATSLISKIHKEFGVDVPLGEIFKNPTIKGISEYISSNRAASVNYIQPVEERDFYPVSSSQRRMFILNQLNPDTTNYNMSMVFKAEGKLGTGKVERAMHALIQRHESLRTSFHIVDGEIVQKIHAEPAVDIVYSIAEGKSIGELEQSFIKPFNLAECPLVRLEVVTLAQDSYLLMFDVHHIISDGFSTGILIKEFMELYQGLELPELKLQYKDYSVWEDELFKSGDIKKQEQYWLETFREKPAKLNMPLDFVRPKYQTFNGTRLRFDITKSVVGKMESIGQKQGATLNMVLCSAFNILLHKYSGQEEIVTGLVMAGRKHLYLDSIIGIFINFLPIRSIVNPSLSFNEFLNAEKAVITGAYDNENYPFDEIVAKVVKEQDQGRNPIFDTMFILHNEYDAKKQYKLPEIDIEAVEVKRFTSKLDFQIDAAIDSDGNLKCSLEYNTNLFKEETMRNFIKHFQMLLDKIAENQEARISELKLFEKQELQDIEKKRSNNNPDSNKLGIVVTSTFTSEPLGEYIKWWCKKFNQDANIEFAPYNQVFQQLLDKSSLVNKNKGISVILIRFEDWIRDIKANEKEKCSILERNYEDLLEALKSKREDSIYLHGIFPITKDLSLGNEIIECMKKLNHRMEEELKQIRNVIPVDLREIEKLYSIKEVYDSYRDKIGHIPFTDEYYAAMGTTIARKICALRRTPFKVIVLDCDNTLWKGVCGEDGALGVKVNKDYEDFQRMLIQKNEEGMLLAICSKNNEKDVWEVFDKNSGMLLKKEYLAAWRINWNSKSENIRELAEELNLGLDSFIFIDDSPVECTEVMMKLPEVLTVNLPEKNGSIPMFIRHIWAFDRAIATKEDKARTKMYIAEKERKKLQEKDVSIEQFLTSLQLKMSMNIIKEENMARAYQLIQRTNQFNLSTIRRTEEELRTLISNENIISWVIEVQDRFGDYGQVGLVIAKKQEATLFIDTFILSCRALGRGIEDAILVGLTEYCKNEGIKTIVADYYPTEKNKPFLEFMKKNTWEKVFQTENYAEYKIDVNEFNIHIDFIDCYYNRNYKDAKGEDCRGSKEEEIYSTSYSQVSAAEFSSDEDEPYWEVKIPGEEALKHIEYLIALNNYSGKKLLKLPVDDKNMSEIVTSKEYEVPGNEIEEKLAGIWTEILKVSEIDINKSFFELGGHSLKATSLVSKIHKEFNVEVPLHEIFRLKTIKSIAKFISDAKCNRYSSIEKVKEKEYYAVSSAQRRMYMLQQFSMDSAGYNIHSAIKIEGVLNVPKIEYVLRKLIERHETLRTYFEVIDTELVQKISSEVDFKLEYTEKNEDEIENFATNFIRPFDLSKAPLIRVALVKVRDNEHILMFDMHHIISDGTSLRLLTDEFAMLYENEKLEKLDIQYRDYAEWQNKLLKSEEMKAQEKYWINRFSEEIPVLNLRTDFARPVIQSFEGSSIKFLLDNELISKLEKVAAETGSTMYMVLLSALNILLSKYSGQEDIIIGSPIAGRNHVELEKIIGMFVNTLAMRNYPLGNMRYDDFLKDVKENALRAYENQDYQFEELVNKLKLQRDVSRNPLFDVMFIMQNMSSKNTGFKGLEFKEYTQKKKVSKFDLTFIVYESGKNKLMEIEYCTKLFNKDTIENMKEHFINILRAVCENTRVELRKIDILTPAEKNRLLYEFNDTYSDYPREQVIQELFEKKVEKMPDAIALICGEERVTYGDLNRRANSLARKLRKIGVVKGSVVGIKIHRSIEMLVGILAVLKAGGAYLPIDPKYPEERVSYMLKDSKAEILLTSESLKKEMGFEGTVVDLLKEENYTEAGDNLGKINSSRDLAYVIYTSGSTGKPKGVMIEHKQVHNFIEGIVKATDLTLYESILCITTISFDIFVLETLVPLAKGIRVVIATEIEQIDGEKLGEIILKNNVEVMQSTPSRVQLLMENHKFNNCLTALKMIMVGGDTLQANLLRQLQQFENLKIFNMYGPTETTVWSAVKDLSSSEEVNIGRPIQNTKIYILDKLNRLQPIGVVGEICIAGEGVTRGYINREDLMKEKYPENPFASGEKMYRTGDMGSWLPNGDIEILGRADNQVKIRGFRIELGEIEENLLCYEDVKEAVVIDKEDGNGIKYLCAYIVGTRDITAKELREYLSNNIPDYMVPSYFMQLEEMPLTPNGKVDRRALRQLDGTIVSGVDYEAPGNEVEEKLAVIWNEILEAREIGINHNFFELGGHSLKATSLVSKIHKEFDVEIPLYEIFKLGTIKKIAEFISSAESSKFISIEPVEEKEFYAVSSAQRRMYMLQQFNLKSVSYNEHGAVRIEGNLNTARLEQVFNELVKRHETLRTSFEIVGTDIVQKVNKKVDFKVEYLEKEEGGIEDFTANFVRPFDLSIAPLMRIGVVKIRDNEHILMFDLHHIISDGVSMSILIKEFNYLYSGKSLKPLRIQYKDYAEWQNKILQTENMKKQEEYWLNRFSGEVPVLKLPLDYPRPAVQQFDGDKIDFDLGSDTIIGLRKIANETNSTMYMVLLSLFNILLHKYTGQEDIVVGSPIAGRIHEDLQDIIGVFINTLAMRNHIEKDVEFKEFLLEVKRNTLEAYENQSYQIEELVSKLKIQVNPSQNPLFTTMFIDENAEVEVEGAELKELKIEKYKGLKTSSKVDITLYAIEAKDKLTFNVEYCTKLFKKATIEEFINCFAKIAQAVAADPVIKIKDITLIDSDKKNEIISAIKQIQENVIIDFDF